MVTACLEIVQGCGPIAETISAVLASYESLVQEFDAGAVTSTPMRPPVHAGGSARWPVTSAVAARFIPAGRGLRVQATASGLVVGAFGWSPPARRDEITGSVRCLTWEATARFGRSRILPCVRLIGLCEAGAEARILTTSCQHINVRSYIQSADDVSPSR